jgi:hypothetical protein
MWAGCGSTLLERHLGSSRQRAQASQDAAVLEPEYVSRLLEASARLSSCVVAEVSVSRTGGVAVAETLVGSALAALNLVQHMENKPLVEDGAVAALSCSSWERAHS